ncbi:hypothetical protein FLP41_01700 (plasmid) [Paracoccus marcusii]|uniref:hypothetical protein n=1 Tax=Paracoccus marcusii TaxID=59779 RepID=UPI002ED59C5D|nr:hypothetical protein FLP41_01700 [Paracoccus marcusii]
MRLHVAPVNGSPAGTQRFGQVDAFRPARGGGRAGMRIALVPQEALVLSCRPCAACADGAAGRSTVLGATCARWSVQPPLTAPPPWPI